MSLSPFILVATIMSAQGPVFEQVTVHPDYSACQQAERQVQKQTKAQKVPYRNPYGKTYYRARVQTYCRLK